MHGGADNRILARIRSERGASLSVALLAILVCVAISAAILAASTAAMGRVAGQGEADQRYYAAMSAAQLFRDSLDADDTVTFVYTQQRTGTREARSGSTDTWEGNVKLVAPVGRAKAANAGYDFLPNITWQALFGGTYAEGSDLNKLASSGWVAPFELTTLDSGANYKTFTYTVEGTGDLDGKNIGVDVEARLWNDADLTLELDFSNNTDAQGNNADEADRYHLYMVLQADVSQSVSRSESLGPTEVVNGTATNHVVIDERQTTTVTWHIRQIVSGRGLAS